MTSHRESLPGFAVLFVKITFDPYIQKSRVEGLRFLLLIRMLMDISTFMPHCLGLRWYNSLFATFHLIYVLIAFMLWEPHQDFSNIIQDPILIWDIPYPYRISDIE